MKKLLAIILALLLLCSSLTCLSACGNTDDANTFTWLIENSMDTTYYSSMNQNPGALFAMYNQQYAGVDLRFDYKQLVKGSEKEQYTTMISTGDYYDVMGMNYSPYSAATLNEMGIALDITEYVEKYMPNYMKLVSENEELSRVAYSKNADGEKRIYTVWVSTDAPQSSFEGFCYRRDWLVKYGVDPQTGEAFEGHKNEDGTYTDNVMFPSWYSNDEYALEYKANHPEWDGSEPIFISDWEWMFEIFDKAREDLGITSQGYDISIYYTGYLATGDLFSAFGGSTPLWGYNIYTDKIEFNAMSKSMQSYLECMNAWYENGWLDKAFSEHSSDMFYKIDIAKVYSGYVGMWQGHRSTLADQLEDTVHYPATEGIYVSGAKQPINDKYGDVSTKGVEPYSMYQQESISAGVIVTESAKDKNLEALFTYMDTFFDPSHDNYMTNNYGLTKEQYEVIYEYQEKVDGKTFQERYGIEDGSYNITEKDGHRLITPVDTLMGDPYLRNATKGLPLKYGIISEYSELSAKEYDSVVNKWDAYINRGMLSNATLGLLSAEDNNTYQKTLAKINDKMSVEIPKFINGTYEIYGEDWDTYCKTINKMGYQKVTNLIQDLFDSFD